MKKKIHLCKCTNIFLSIYFPSDNFCKTTAQFLQVCCHVPESRYCSKVGKPYDIGHDIAVVVEYERYRQQQDDCCHYPSEVFQTIHSLNLLLFAYPNHPNVMVYPNSSILNK